MREAVLHLHRSIYFPQSPGAEIELYWGKQRSSLPGAIGNGWERRSRQGMVMGGSLEKRDFQGKQRSILLPIDSFPSTADHVLGWMDGAQ